MWTGDATPGKARHQAEIEGQLLGLQIAGLDPGFVNRRNALVEAVTVEDVARVARRILRTQELSFVIVGRPEGILPAN